MSEDSVSAGFGGLRVVAFESRFAVEIGNLISRHNGEALLAPSMKEVPLGQNVAAFEFAERLLAGGLKLVLFMTGVGTRVLAGILESRYPKEPLLSSLSQLTVVARGPKSLSALRHWGVPVSITVPEPNTWREVLEALDTSEKCPPLSGLNVAIQEYGIPNWRLVDGLRERGASVLQVPVYRWTLPDDLGPMQKAIHAVLDKKCEVALFTNAMQVVHLFQVAELMGKVQELRASLDRMVVGSVGPTCSQELRDQGVRVDVEPVHPKMGQLIKEAAERSLQLLRDRSRKVEGRLFEGSQEVSTEESRGAAGENVIPGKLEASAFMRACRCQPTAYTPIWLMRQAGRYMAEYREIRSRHSFLDLCKDSDLAAEVTVTAAHRLGVDAAIIFADILLIVEPLGLGLRFEKGDGPTIEGIVRSQADVDRLREVEPEDSLRFVFDAVRKTRAGLRPDIPLIGFSAAPFTLASYITEGGASKHYRHTKALMHHDPGAWHSMMEIISRGLVKYLNGQISAGAQVVQIFDSWVGCLGPEDYREYVLPHTKSVIAGVHSGVPVINFSTGTSGYLELVRQAGGEVIGVDWRVDLSDAWARLGGDVGIMGNLDPLVLFSDRKQIMLQARKILTKVAGRPGHIFNLGHGILPETPVENVIALVEAVHKYHPDTDEIM